MFIFTCFVLGTIIGSFLGVVIDRLPRGKTIVKGRSHCDHCRHTLSALDLVPLVSFLALRGKCRYCHSSIGWNTFFIECITGLLFVITFLFAQPSFEDRMFSFAFFTSLLYYLYIASSMIAIFFIDLEHGIIPNKIVYPAVVVSLVYLAVFHTTSLPQYLFSSLAAFAFFFLLYVFTRKKGMGLGDVKFALLMGLVLGFPGIVIALYIAFLTGAFIACMLVLWGKKKFGGGTVPFGPFLVLGTLISLFAGGIIWIKIMQVL
jgi:leader peptidase (prepilin peptidase) / N-methyltransferase